MRARGARSRAARAHREGNVLQHAEVREQHPVLERDPDRPPLGRKIVDRFVVEHDGAARGGDEPDDRFDDRRLAGAVRTQERDGLVVPGGERRGDGHVAAGNLDRGLEHRRAALSGAP